MRTILALLMTGIVLGAAGCSPKPVKVTGRLLKDGQPQTFAEDQYVTVTFRPEKKDPDDTTGTSSYPATLNRPAGTYEVELMPGRYFVNVFVPPPKAGSGPGPKKPMGPPPAGDKAGGKVYEIKSAMTLDLTVP